MQLITPFLAAAILATNAVAHPGHDSRFEMAERAAFMQTSRRDLTHCASQIKARGIDSKTVARRANVAKAARKERSIAEDAPFLRVRDAASVLNTTHLSSEGYTNTTAETILFAGNNSCVLSPEVTQGPYYVSGEYVRKDIIDEQDGIELILDTQVIDMATCDPVPSAMIEIWHCNSTGVYSGIIASGNGDSSDAANINATFLRGLQPTDDDGVAQFVTLFPGHYTSRSNHIHVLVHFNGTIYANGTYGGGYVSHVGQLFFDQDLITLVEATSPYDTNTQVLTLNSEDSVFAQEAASSDPVVEYSLLGESVSDGIFGWIAFGIDLSIEETITPAASLYASGGVEDSSSSSGGNGTGVAPSGVLSS